MNAKQFLIACRKALSDGLDFPRLQDVDYSVILEYEQYLTEKGLHADDDSLDNWDSYCEMVSA